MGEIGKILVFLVFYENFEEKPEKPIFFSRNPKILKKEIRFDSSFND